MQRRKRNPAHDTCGAASVEAVLVLPVFAIALLGMMFLGHFYAAQDSARTLTRRCALEYAMGGCERVPPGCEAVLSAAELDAGRAEARGLRKVAASADTFGVLDLPLIGDAIEALFGTAVRAHDERSLARPWGKEKAQVAADFVVLCNEHPVDVAAAVERVFCDLVPVVECQ